MFALKWKEETQKEEFNKENQFEPKYKTAKSEQQKTENKFRKEININRGRKRRFCSICNLTERKVW